MILSRAGAMTMHVSFSPFEPKCKLSCREEIKGMNAGPPIPLPSRSLSSTTAVAIVVFAYSSVA
jgi:hypothetical protein